jgi:hypothetical protein
MPVVGTSGPGITIVEDERASQSPGHVPAGEEGGER